MKHCVLLQSGKVKIQQIKAYFITSTIVDWIPVFTKEKYFRILFDNFIFYQHKHKIEIIAYVIMDNHFHMICKSKTLNKAIQSLKSYTAKKIVDELKTDGKDKLLETFREKKLEHKTESEYQLWQEGFHPQEMINGLLLKQKIEYIHYNPVRKGLVSKPEDWKYSSARYYFPKPGLGKEKGG